MTHFVAANFNLILAMTLMAVGGLGIVVGYLLAPKRRYIIGEPGPEILNFTYRASGDVQPPDPYPDSLRGH